MKLSKGNQLTPLTLTTISNETISLPFSEKLTHLQFRRFAGCPVCNLHLQSFFSRHDEVSAHHIEEVIVFHATAEKMRESVVETNFHLIADPEKKLYDKFGLENSYKSLFSSKVMSSAFKGMALKQFTLPEKMASEFIVPADFLINQKGEIIAVKYGTHADDQWSVDELLALAENHNSSQTR